MTRLCLPERRLAERGLAERGLSEELLVKRPLTPGPSPAKGRGEKLRTAAVIFTAVLLNVAFIAHSSVLYAADPQPLTAPKLKKQALDAIRTGAVQYTPAKNEIADHKMLVTMAFIPAEMEVDAETPLVKVFYDQVEVELLRKNLLQRQSSRQIMEPYYAKAEAVIAKKLAVAQDAKLTDDARHEQLDKLEEEENKAFSDGLTAVARSIGMVGFEYQVGAANDAHDVKLVAAKGAMIDLVRQTTAALLHDAGKQDKDFPWTSYQQGDTATLNGVYYCRIRLNGKEATSTKRVGEKTEQLEFPDP